MHSFQSFRLRLYTGTVGRSGMNEKGRFTGLKGGSLIEIKAERQRGIAAKPGALDAAGQAVKPKPKSRAAAGVQARGCGAAGWSNPARARPMPAGAAESKGS